jgi:hypothetical protein
MTIIDYVEIACGVAIVAFAVFFTVSAGFFKK